MVDRQRRLDGSLFSKEARTVSRAIHEACGDPSTNRDYPWKNSIRNILVDVFSAQLDEKLPGSLQELESPVPVVEAATEEGSCSSEIEPGGVVRPAPILPGDAVYPECPSHDDRQCRHCKNPPNDHRRNQKHLVHEIHEIGEDDAGGKRKVVEILNTTTRGHSDNLRCPEKFLVPWEEARDSREVEARTPVLRPRTLQDLLDMDNNFEDWLRDADFREMPNLASLTHNGDRYLLVFRNNKEKIFFESAVSIAVAETQVEEAINSQGNGEHYLLGAYDLCEMVALSIKGISLKLKEK